MKKSFFSVVVLLIFAPALNAAPIRSENNLNFPKITSYRSASCGCCKKWVNHLRSSGLEVVDNVVEDISLIKDQYSIPNNLRSCHTAKMENYLIEGHVPFESIKKLNLNLQPLQVLLYQGCLMVLQEWKCTIMVHTLTIITKVMRSIPLERISKKRFLIKLPRSNHEK